MKTSEVQAVRATSGHDVARGSQSGTRVHMKLTRSRAWVEEYVSSGDPVKLLFATVYDYHDPSGEFVAEPFHELPSSKVQYIYRLYSM